MYNFATNSHFLGFKKKPPMRKPKPVAFFIKRSTYHMLTSLKK